MTTSKGNPTLVGGVPNGGTTESGNVNHNAKTGKFESGTASSSTANMTEQEIKNHNIDKTVNVPHFDKTFKPFLQELLDKYNGKVFNVEEMDQYSPGFAEELDKRGVDYVININGEKYKAVDLKSIQPFGDVKSEIITLPIDHYDNKLFDKKKNRQGRHVQGWFVKDNTTDYLAFQFLTNIKEQEPDAFLIDKKHLKETIFNNYFSDYGSNSGEAFKKITDEFRQAKHQLLTKQGNIESLGYDIRYDKNDPNKVKDIRKAFKSESFGHVIVKMKFDYRNNKINHDLVILLPSRKLKTQCEYVSLNKEEKEKHDIGKLLGVVI